MSNGPFSPLGDVNMWALDALACGSMLRTDDTTHNRLVELLRPREHLVTYLDAGDLLEKVAWYLVLDHERGRIASAGRAEAVAKHTYRHRMEQVLAAVEARFGGMCWTMAEHCSSAIDASHQHSPPCKERFRLIDGMDGRESDLPPVGENWHSPRCFLVRESDRRSLGC
jgi:hypothetical protein